MHEDDLFTSFALEAISGAAAAQAPLFLYFAPHAAHQPLEVPDAQLARFDFVCANDTSKQCQWRKQYAALVNLVDGHVGRILDALKAAGMWENSLVYVGADNGGPIYGGAFTCQTCDGDAGANNFPLRGGKHSNFEGGVRVNALVSGGLVPAATRGTVRDGLVAIEDVFTTFVTLAGLDPADKRGAAAGLPPIDGFDAWPYLSGANATSPRSEVVLGSGLGGAADGATAVQGVIRADGFKVLVGSLDNAVWQGAFYPNASTSWRNTPVNCSGGCLYNVFADPSELDDLAASQPAVLAEMLARVADLQAGVYSPMRGPPSELACAASERCGGFVCPFAP